jgi:dTDP-glucose pyrophosphorylase
MATKAVRKAVIMAAGRGVRMLPLTKLVPKPLVKVNGKPFLYYVMAHLRKAGYTDIALIVGYKNHMIPAFLREHNFRATIILQKKRLGTGHAMRQAERFAGKSNFIALGGDNLWSAADLKSIQGNDGLNYVATVRVKNPRRYGVVLAKGNGMMERIVEKPQRFVGNMINTGLYKFTPDIFAALKKIKKSPRGEYELTDAISLLAQQGKVKVVSLRDYWLDLGKLSDIGKIEARLRKLGE